MTNISEWDRNRFKGKLFRDGSLDYYVREVTDRADRQASRRRVMVTRTTMVRSRQPSYTVVVVDKKTGKTYVTGGRFGQEAVKAVDQIYPKLNVDKMPIQQESKMGIPNKVASIITEDPDTFGDPGQNIPRAGEFDNVDLGSRSIPQSIRKYRHKLAQEIQELTEENGEFDLTMTLQEVIDRLIQ